MPQTIYEFNPAATAANLPVLHLAVANGFPPQTYEPLLKPLTDRYHIVSLPPRPLWTDPPPPKSVKSWKSLAEDLLAGLKQYNLTNVIAVGHSFGGIASMLAAIAEPQRFRALVLLDPTILPPPILLAAKLLRPLGVNSRNALVQGARRRRSQFADADEAFAYWRGKTLFTDWSDETLRLYVQGLTRPASNANGSATRGGIELTWSPEWEAYYYTLLFPDSWRYVPKLRGLLPVLTIRGTTSNTFFPNAAARMRRILPDMTYAEIEGHGHLFPQSAPDQTRQIIEKWLAAKAL
jgi:pimeloyl-ACP methyl ester carboxylesterase